MRLLRPILRAPRTQDEWDRLHAIRRTHIFDVYHPPSGPWPCEYDPAHPDDRDQANKPLLLFVGGQAVGTLRLDVKPDEGWAVVRLVALDPGFRGTGLGGAMLGIAEAIARETGASALCVNAQPGVVDFYAHLGFTPGWWEGCSSCSRGVPMIKALTPELCVRSRFVGSYRGVLNRTRVALVSSEPSAA